MTTNVNAKRLTPQGFAEPFALTYLGYRHKFSDALFAVVTVQDPFEGLRFRQVIETPTSAGPQRPAHPHPRDFLRRDPDLRLRARSRASRPSTFGG